MDYDKVFIKGASKTSIGGQAVMEGVMMRGRDRTAVALRLPNGSLYIKTSPNKSMGNWEKFPIVRGVIAFFSSLILGMETLLYSAKILEDFENEEALNNKVYKSDENPKESLKGSLDKTCKSKDNYKQDDQAKERENTKKTKDFDIAIYVSLVISIIVSILLFILLPTAAVNFLKYFTHNFIVLNLVEGIIRLLIFLCYIIVISKMEDIKRVFQYHGAEHKSIHCFEKGLELNVENAESFYTLHPRCGTSFLMFVMIISIVLFSFFGWPNLGARVLIRILLLPVVAGLSYEVLKLAGKSDNFIIRILSLPGLYLQKITTNEPDQSQLEVALVSLKAVLVEKDTPYIEGYCNSEGKLLEENSFRSFEDFYNIDHTEDTKEIDILNIDYDKYSEFFDCDDI